MPFTSMSRAFAPTALTVVTVLAFGAATPVRGETVIAMPPPPPPKAEPTATSAAPAVAAPSAPSTRAASAAAHPPTAASSTTIDPGVLALRRYAGARSRPYDTYRSTPDGWRDSGEVWSYWGRGYRHGFGGPFIGYGFFRYGWPWSITIDCGEGE